VTADISIPAGDLQASIKEYSQKSHGLETPPPVIAWLSWRRLDSALKTRDPAAARDLCDLLSRLDMRYYELNREVRSVAQASWRFSLPAAAFAWASGDEDWPQSVGNALAGFRSQESDRGEGRRD
jgi:hypothetical protein